MLEHAGVQLRSSTSYGAASSPAETISTFDPATEYAWCSASTPSKRVLPARRPAHSTRLLDEDDFAGDLDDIRLFADWL